MWWRGDRRRAWHLAGVLLVVVLLALLPAGGRAVEGAPGLGIDPVLDLLELVKVILDAAYAILSLTDSFADLWEKTVYPLEAVQRARELATQIIERFRGLFDALLHTAVASATLPDPAALEQILRSGSAADLAALDAAYAAVYATAPPAGEADPIDREWIDMSDAAVKAMLKTLQEADEAADLTVVAAEFLETEAQYLAPGSAAYASGAGLVAAARSQAVVLRLLAAGIRLEAAQLAHDNARRKRSVTFGEEFRRTGADLLRRP